jgi:hypothetical protein
LCCCVCLLLLQMAVMISGLPGAMGKEVAAACLRRCVCVCVCVLPWLL